jgi:hypothetical protein
MKYILLALAMLINISVFSQDKYNLFILGNRTFTGFTGDNSLKGVDQIYYLEKDSSWIVGETSMVFCNEYLTFSVDSGHVTVHWYDEPIYYYFFRRYAFLEKIWN